jgi:hypothetical protein
LWLTALNCAGTLAKIAEVSTDTASMAPITASDNAVVRYVIGQSSPV